MESYRTAVVMKFTKISVLFNDDSVRLSTWLPVL
jgi:hypothetical protein